ncbi:hypothetical protein BDN72DRAFT_958236 [Pluteus cervinus]|uniref:Uncharacterized protein n=1 Tax=Pluteus cervinus TaxID=181527 RepID=A0ACD3B097_9AGAR|nr:hypothetical protein BDN72DRAFT_958236 [Pluteus cervinus]
MFKSLALIAVAASGVFAQQSASASGSAATPSASSNSTSSSSSNPLIPTGISSDCTTFLTSLNSDTSLTACTSTLISTLKSYGPGSSTNHTKSDVESTLTSFCSSTTSQACPESLIRGKIAAFYPACTAELTGANPNKDVLDLYQVFYAISPLQAAVCTKDDSGNWCATQERGASSVKLTTRSLERRDDTVTPNLPAYESSNLPFLFINGTADKATLCTVCTRNILNSYFSFENNIPSAIGYNQGLLSTQTPLINAVQTTCGTNFLSGTVAAAGGLGNALDGAGFARAELQTPVAALMGVLSVLAAFAL